MDNLQVPPLRNMQSQESVSETLSDATTCVSRRSTDDEEKQEKVVLASLGDEAEPDDYVTWDGPDDPQNPQNFSFSKKVVITAIYVFGSLVTCIASSLYASGAAQIAREFDVSKTVVTLGISVFLIGYTIGPPLWGPLSERYGRRYPLLISLALSALLTLPAALARSATTLLVSRFLIAAFGVAPQAILGGGLVDIWNPVSRAIGMTFCMGAIFGAPLVAPVVGNFLVADPALGWRWTQWLNLIVGGVSAVVAAAGLSETHAPTLLRQKAARLRRETGNKDLRSKFDEQLGLGVTKVVKVFVLRPFAMLFTEPILLLVTIYQSFIYGILYLVFVSYPIAFQEVRHWKLGVSGLAYLGMLLGVIIGAAVIIVQTRTRFAALTQRNGGKVVPEQRLPLMIVGGVLLPVGLFIFAWTSDPSVHWSGMIVGSVPVGMGMFMVFVQCLNYLIDVYSSIANSAIAANAFVRSFVGAAFPLFGPVMYHRLGVDWATTILALIGVAMIPIPVLFYKYGHTIRGWSKNPVNKA